MEDRRQKILDYTVRNFIKTAQPVGSGLVMEEAGLDVSSATIRNELLELENEGYIYQPYTSAGRVPTEKGYKFWLTKFAKEKKLEKNKQNSLIKIKDQYKDNKEKLIKELAKEVSEITGTAVIVGFNINNIYYTGISNLFAQPEFKKYELIYTISGVVDGLDEILPSLFSKVNNQESILIGSDNPFSEECSIVMTNFGRNSLFTLLGPIRMDYEENVATIKFLKELINK